MAVLERNPSRRARFHQPHLKIDKAIYCLAHGIGTRPK